MRYLKLSGNGISANVVIAVNDDARVDAMKLVYGSKGYSLEECEAPKDATIVDQLAYMSHRAPQPFVREEWDGPCCSRCKNRFALSSEWCLKHYRESNCYRFKLDL